MTQHNHGHELADYSKYETASKLIGDTISVHASLKNRSLLYGRNSTMNQHKGNGNRTMCLSTTLFSTCLSSLHSSCVAHPSVNTWANPRVSLNFPRPQIPLRIQRGLGKPGEYHSLHMRAVLPQCASMCLLGQQVDLFCHLYRRGIYVVTLYSVSLSFHRSVYIFGESLH